MESLLTQKEIAEYLRRIRRSERLIPVLWVFATVAAISKVVRFDGGALRDALLDFVIFIYIPFLLTAVLSFTASNSRNLLKADSNARKYILEKIEQEEKEAIISDQKRLAAQAGNKHNREVQEQARLYYEAGQWPTKAAACSDIAEKFRRAPKTVERWISRWANDLDRDDAQHRP